MIKACQNCGEKFEARGPAKYCTDCREKVRAEQNRKRTEEWCKTHRSKNENFFPEIKNNERLEETVKAARENGLSYGKLKAMAYMEQVGKVDTTLSVEEPKEELREPELIEIEEEILMPEEARAPEPVREEKSTRNVEEVMIQIGYHVGVIIGAASTVENEKAGKLITDTMKQIAGLIGELVDEEVRLP